MSEDLGSLVNRLRGVYTIPVNDGAGPLNGSDTFTREFGGLPPIQEEAAKVIEELANSRDMLCFLISQFQMYSPRMDGQHSYRFRSSGWPMTHFKGPDVESAIQSAMNEVQRSAEETA